MLQFFRNFFQSKLGIGVSLGFLVLIALAFASGDVASSGGFGGVAGGDRAASVGRERISTSALSKAVSTSFENLKQENPRLSMQAFLAQGGLEKVLDEMLSRTALAVFGRENGVIAGDRLVDSEIAKLPAFQGPDGRFSEAVYNQLLQQQGLNDQLVRDDLAQGLIARQILVPAAFGAVAPNEFVNRYAALLRERRTGAIALLPAAAFAPQTPPADSEIQAFYARNSASYIRPERRVIRYAAFDDTALRTVAAPSEAEIAARFQANSAQYAASETRRVTQLIVPTEAAARALMAELAGGKTLEAAASGKGLATSAIGPVAKAALSGQTSQAVADAVFATQRGRVAGPARSGLGWHLMRVDVIEAKPARTLADVRGELVEQLTTIKRRQAIVDLSARMEEAFDNGGNLADAAKELGLTVTSTQPLTADGQVYGKPGEMGPPELARVIQTAFSMENENEPQLAEVEPGKRFVIFDVTDIAPSAAAPLAEIRADVIADLQLEKGAAAAKAAAERLLAQVRGGMDIGAAMAAIGRPLPPVDRIDMGREQLAQLQAQQVPPPVALLFSMAEGTVKTLAAPRNRGWYVVALRDIVPGQVAANDPLAATARRELGMMAGREYAESMRRAIRSDLGVERNENAIRAVRTQLTGGN